MDHSRLRFINTQEDYNRWRGNMREKFDIDLESVHTKNQLDVLLRRKGFYNTISDKTPDYLISIKTKRILDSAYKLLKESGDIAEKEVAFVPVERPPVKRVPRPEIEVVITPRGFKKQQIRDKKTGRIIGWI